METNKVEWMVLMLLQDQGVPPFNFECQPPQLSLWPRHPPAPPPPHPNVNITVKAPKQSY